MTLKEGETGSKIIRTEDRNAKPRNIELRPTTEHKKHPTYLHLICDHMMGYRYIINFDSNRIEFDWKALSIQSMQLFPCKKILALAIWQVYTKKLDSIHLKEEKKSIIFHLQLFILLQFLFHFALVLLINANAFCPCRVCCAKGNTRGKYCYHSSFTFHITCMRFHLFPFKMQFGMNERRELHI